MKFEPRAFPPAAMFPRMERKCGWHPQVSGSPLPDSPLEMYRSVLRSVEYYGGWWLAIRTVSQTNTESQGGTGDEFGTTRRFRSVGRGELEWRRSQTSLLGPSVLGHD